jgi:hypothetical protein
MLLEALREIDCRRRASQALVDKLLEELRAGIRTLAEALMEAPLAPTDPKVSTTPSSNRSPSRLMPSVYRIRLNRTCATENPTQQVE